MIEMNKNIPIRERTASPIPNIIPSVPEFINFAYHFSSTANLPKYIQDVMIATINKIPVLIIPLIIACDEENVAIQLKITA